MRPREQIADGLQQTAEDNAVTLRHLVEATARNAAATHGLILALQQGNAIGKQSLGGAAVWSMVNAQV